jgi:hypothetical protein
MEASVLKEIASVLKGRRYFTEIKYKNQVKKWEGLLQTTVDEME